MIVVLYWHERFSENTVSLHISKHYLRNSLFEACDFGRDHRIRWITEQTVAVYYLWQRSNEHLQANLADYEETYQANSRQQAEMAQQRDQLVQRREERNALLRELKGIILQGQQLEKRCIGFSRLQIEEEKKLLWAQRVGLEENLRSMEQYNLGQIERRLHDAQREAQQLE